jgi:hypothetical protein
MSKSSKVSSTASRSARAPRRSTPTIVTPESSRISGRRLLPVKVAAQRLGLSVWGVRAMAYQSRISSHKIGARLMIAEDEIDRIISESERPRVA